MEFKSMLRFLIVCFVFCAKAVPIRDPCRTNPDGFNRLVCDNITQIKTLTQSLRKASQSNILEVSVRFSNLTAIPMATIDFLGFLFVNLRTVTVESLFDRVPEGQSSLEQLHLDDVRILSTWSWEPVSSFRNLKRFSVSNMVIPTIDNSMTDHLSERLQSFSLNSTSTSIVAPEAFSKFNDLVYISIQNNNIEKLDRRMFPSPSKIRYFYFGRNKISSLPEDIFTEMPELHSVGFQDNFLSEIKQIPFSQVWHKLSVLYLEGNPLKCECQMSWIVAHGAPAVLTGHCKAPKDNYGKLLENLVMRDFPCQKIPRHFII